MAKVTVLGCGRWASFHAWYQAEKLANDVLVWGRQGDPIYDDLLRTRKNRYLTLPDAVQMTDDLGAALAFADDIIIAIAAQAMPEFSAQIKKHHPKNKTFILCMKSIDQNTGERLSEVLAKQVDASNQICVWVGPGHAEELSANKPNVMVLAGAPALTARLATAFSSPLVTLLENDDLLGVEIGAAAKNVLGIAAGFLDGLGQTSLKGALMVRGCDEVSRLISAMGGQRLTAFGMSHLGDFEATLFSKNSHNRRYGEEFIRHELSNDIGTAEGVGTTRALHSLAEKYGVQMPIADTVYRALYEDLPADQVVTAMFRVTARREFSNE